MGTLGDYLAGLGKQAIEQAASDLIRQAGSQARTQMAKGARTAMFGDWGTQMGSKIAGVGGIGMLEPDIWPSWFTHILTRESGYVMYILGRRDSGKTSFAMNAAEYSQKADGSYIYVPGYPEHLAPSHIIAVPQKNLGELLHMAQPGSTILLDDASLIYNSKRTMSNAGLEFEDAVNTVAHGALRMIITVQDSSDMHKAGLRADVLAFKPPERMYAASERPAMRPIIEQAQREFAKIPQVDIPKYIWLYRDPEHHQMVQYSLPKWLTRRRAKWRGQGKGNPFGRHSEQDAMRREESMTSGPAQNVGGFYGGGSSGNGNGWFVG